MAWLRVSVVPAELAHLLADALEEQEALAVTLADAEDEPVYEPTQNNTALAGDARGGVVHSRR